MSWFKLDDRFFDNPKIVPLSDAAKVAYLEAGTYCARELTDGFLPVAHARRYAGKPRVVQELVPQLWEPCDGGFLLHDYLKYNPTREQVLAERDAARRRMFGRSSGEVRAKKEEESGEDSPSPVPDPLSVSNETDPPKARAKKSRARGIEEIDLAKAADDHPTLDVGRELTKFSNDLKQKGKTWTDYVAAFDNWLLKAEEFRERDAQVQRHTPGRNAVSGESKIAAFARREGLG